MQCRAPRRRAGQDEHEHAVLAAWQALEPGTSLVQTTGTLQTGATLELQGSLVRQLRQLLQQGHLQPGETPSTPTAVLQTIPLEHAPTGAVAPDSKHTPRIDFATPTRPRRFARHLPEARQKPVLTPYRYRFHVPRSPRACWTYPTPPSHDRPLAARWPPPLSGTRTPHTASDWLLHTRMPGNGPDRRP